MPPHRRRSQQSPSSVLPHWFRLAIQEGTSKIAVYDLGGGTFDSRLSISIKEGPITVKSQPSIIMSREGSCLRRISGHCRLVVTKGDGPLGGFWARIKPKRACGFRVIALVARAKAKQGQSSVK